MGAVHTHSHGANANSRMLMVALAMTTSYLIAEVIGSFVFNSLALLSDAAHMLTDVVALAIALAAIRIGQRSADETRTFGYRRFEILAAAFNALLLFAVAGYVLWESIGRFFLPEPVGSTGMLVVAAFGLLVNIVSMRLLAAGKDKSLNVKGAYLEVWADMLGSVGVILGACVIMYTGWKWVDPAVAVGIGLWVLPRTWLLLKDTTHILLEGVPTRLSIAEIRAAIGRVEGVEQVHDLHVWSMTSDDSSLSVHIVLAAGGDAEKTRRATAEQLRQRYEIRHVTIQIEQEACADADFPHP